MQNHGGYSSEYDNFTNNISAMDVENSGVDQYLSLISLTDQNLEKLIDYFYANTIFDSELVNIDTPLVLLDEQTEYEAGYSDCCSGKVTLKASYVDITVPVDFYVAGFIAHNFDENTNQNLLKALAISS